MTLLPALFDGLFKTLFFKYSFSLLYNILLTKQIKF